MNRPLTAIEGIDYKEENKQLSVTQEDIIAMHRKEYEKLISKEKEELVRMIMGDEAYYDAICLLNIKDF